MRGTVRRRRRRACRPTTRSTSSCRRPSRCASSSSIAAARERGSLPDRARSPIGEAPRFETSPSAAGRALGRRPAAQRRRRAATTWPCRPPLGAAAGALRRAGRRPVRGAGPRATLAAGRRPPAGDACGSPSIGRAATPARVGALEYGHPVFEPFRAPRSGDFSAVPVYGYRAVDAGDGRAGARAIRRRRAGAARAARRHAAACCSGPRRSTSSWSDLPLKPVFLPFVHQVGPALSRLRASRRPG